MNLPNKLTLFRILMVPVFLIVMVALPLPDTLSRCICAVIYVVTCLTDMLDGRIARKYGLITDFGKFMDPLADKFIVFAALLGILTKYTYLQKTFIWAAAIVIFRELAVTSIRLVAAGNEGMVISASILGKIKTVTQMVCITTIIIEPVILPWSIFREKHLLSYVTMAVMTVMTVWSGLDYLKKYYKFISPSK